jgi:stage IV sporulation protein FB
LFSFRLLRIPVRVRPSFLLIAALLGFFGASDPVLIAAWIAIVFISILVHELGHALTARAYGAEVEIELNGVGGLTRWSIPSHRLGPGRRALVAAAGSAVGVLFGGLIWLVASQFGPYRGLTFFVINRLVFVNVFWGLLNWLPIRPLDGGHLLLSFLEKFAPVRGEVIARVVFMATAAAGLFYGIRSDRLFIAVIAGFLLFSEFTSGQPSAELPAGPIPEFSYDDEPRQTQAEDVDGEEADDGRAAPDG